ncbi:MAG: SDR family NAD(P)-dependent oxidoreductase, partial [Myxococcales bacterium]|nr:SDR family NAD(P)-dependent oxidoreductase [Myxococcales bacterium]
MTPRTAALLLGAVSTLGACAAAPEWQRQLLPALSAARDDGRELVVYFALPGRDASDRMQASLTDPRVLDALGDGGFDAVIADATAENVRRLYGEWVGFGEGMGVAVVDAAGRCYATRPGPQDPPELAAWQRKCAASRAALAALRAKAGDAEARPRDLHAFGALLLELGCKQAWSSRDHHWFECLQTATDGAGVDVVLNTLPGEDMRLGLEALRSGGRFLEIGRTDIYSNRRLGLEVFRKNVAFHAIDIGEAALLASPTLSEGFRALAARVEAGRYHPLPCKVWPIDRGAEALREMARGRHTGKLVLQVSDPQGQAPRVMLPLAKAYEIPSFGGTWLITGGAGALGMRCAKMLVDAGITRVVLAGRRPPSPEAMATITALIARGSQVSFVACDIAQRSQITALIGTYEHELEGVIHCAGVLDDALLADLDDARFERVVAAKVEGARLLDELTRELPLMHFVLFSSLSAELGSPGQAAYALANAYLDGLAEARRARGQAALSVAWGAWKDIGLAADDERRGARLARRGLPSLGPDAGIELLARLLNSDSLPASVSATPLDWPSYRQAQPAMALTPRFALLETGGTRTATK